MAGITNYFDNETIMSRVRDYINARNAVFENREPLTYEDFLRNLNDKNSTFEGACRFCANYNPNGSRSCSLSCRTCKEEILWHIVRGNEMPKSADELDEVVDKICMDAADAETREERKEVKETRRTEETEETKEINFFDNETVMSRAEDCVKEIKECFNTHITIDELFEEISKCHIPHACCSFCRKYKVENAEENESGDDCSFEFGCYDEIIWHIVKGNEDTNDEEEFENIIVKAQNDAAEKVASAATRIKVESKDTNNIVSKDAKDNTISVFVDPMVEKPTHYTGGAIECIDAIAAAVEGLQGIEAFDTGNAIKYLWRWKRKNGKQDLEKARWYVNHLIAHLAHLEKKESEN